MFRRRTALAGAVATLVAGMLPIQARAQGQNPVGYLRTNWSRDPFAFGSYSYYAKTEQPDDRAALRAPLGKSVFFAGEAMHPRYFSTVHAAYESGLEAAKAVSQTSAKRIAIVGAGMSGLAAAHQLAEQGYDVKVYEARDRIGGRVYTSAKLEVPMDLGASWIHGVKGNPLTELADELKLERIPTDDEWTIRGANGHEIEDEEAPDWLTDGVEMQTEAGADLDQVDFDAFEEEEGYDGDQVIFPNGYSQIFDALKGDYEVKLGAKLVSVNWGEKARLGFEDGSIEDFDAVIITVPLGVLKANTIAFEPKLPENKIRAIERVGMGVLDKLYLQFDEVYWDDTTWIATPETGLPQGQFNLWLNFAPLIGEPILCAFNGGSATLALAELSDEELITHAMSVLNQTYPSKV